jgi:MFS family permease
MQAIGGDEAAFSEDFDRISAVQRDAIGRAGLYLGGFLGPFGGGVLTVLVPNLSDELHVSTTVVALAIPAYLVPFAVLQLVSGTVGERLGIVGTVRAAFIAYAVASAAVAAVSSIGPFLVARAAQGAANAFTSPLILAVLAESADDATLGRTMGTFAAVQTAGMVSAPLCGGLLGAIDPRLAFLVPGLVALALAVVPLPIPRRRTAHPPRLRTAFNRRVGWLALAAALAFFAILGVALPVSLRATNVFGIGTTLRGVLLALFGLGGVFVGRAAGGLVDRTDSSRVAIAGAFGCACVLPLLGLADSAALVGVLWFVCGMGSAVLWAGLNTMAVRSTPQNRAGAVSVIGAFKFAGAAAAPIVWVPIYDAKGWVAFAAAGLAAAAIAPAVLRARWTDASPGVRAPVTVEA